jgi:hypothetical protein
MADPHNKKKYGLTWDEIHTAVMRLQIEWILKEAGDNVVVSGGWAWCLMSPDHVEYRHAHDLKDIDLFVKPNFLGDFVTWLNLLNYTRDHTKYDGLSPFYRYSTMLRGIGCTGTSATPIDKKVILDVFVQDVPSVKVEGISIVEPQYLSSLYGKHDPDSLLHGSGQCWSLAQATKVFAQDESPINHPAMADFSGYLDDNDKLHYPKRKRASAFRKA